MSLTRRSRIHVGTVTPPERFTGLSSGTKQQLHFIRGDEPDLCLCA